MDENRVDECQQVIDGDEGFAVSALNSKHTKGPTWTAKGLYGCRLYIRCKHQAP